MKKELLQQIEDKLLRGGKTEIAHKAGVSIFTVIRFFKGENQNKKVLMATNEYLMEVGTSLAELNKMVAA